MESPLLTAIRLGGLELKNRVVMAPLTRGRAGKERVANALMAEYYAQRATAGLIISEATVISERGIGWVDSPGIYTQEMVEGWKLVTDSVAERGGKIFLQLWHCGRASHSDFHDGKLPLSSSDIPISQGEIRTPLGKKTFEAPQPMSLDDIQQTIDDYRQAAVNAFLAGFDGVELHAANGYLLNQFIDSRCNQRSDQYGGSIENRSRILFEVLDAITEVAPAGRVAVRISPNGVFNDMGADDYRETFLYIAKKLNDYPLAYLHVMDGLAFGFHQRGEPMTLPEFKQVYGGVIMGNCGYDQGLAESSVTEGMADLVAFGRPYITNPDLVERFANGWPLEPCDDMAHWYTSGAEGYTDYHPYKL